MIDYNDQAQDPIEEPFCFVCGGKETCKCDEEFENYKDKI
jgi:hypothetical protein